MNGVSKISKNEIEVSKINFLVFGNLTYIIFTMALVLIVFIIFFLIFAIYYILTIKRNRRTQPKALYKRDSSAVPRTNKTKRENEKTEIYSDDEESNQEFSDDDDDDTSKATPHQPVINKNTAYNNQKNFVNNKATGKINTNTSKPLQPKRQTYMSPVSVFTIDESIATTPPPVFKKDPKKITAAQKDKLKIAREIRRPSPDIESEAF